MDGPSHTTEQLPRIGRYVVEEKLGEGGMAETWLAHVVGVPDHYVVIKTIMPERLSPEYEVMFVDEARIGSRLKHPNIPHVIEFGHTPGGAPFMVQEFVDGPSVLQLLSAQRGRGPLDLRVACRITADIARALDFAHRATDERGNPLQVVHRDVSPTNILVSKEGMAKLIDFGVARFADRSTETQTGILKGKLPFMPPEAIMQGAATHQGDLYALGIVLYRMCTGRMPTLIAEAGTYGGFEPPSRRRPEIDEELESIMLRCIHTDRAQRYASGDQIVADLSSWFLRNGGPATDQEITEHLYGIFGDPDLSEVDSDAHIPALAAQRAVGRKPKRRRFPSVVAVLAIAALLGVSLAAVGGALAFLALTPQAMPGLHVAPPDQRASTLMDAAERALVTGNLGEAETKLADAHDMVLTDPEVAARRTALASRVDLFRRIQRIEARAQHDITAALADARALAREHPDSMVVAQLIETLESRR